MNAIVLAANVLLTLYFGASQTAPGDLNASQPQRGNDFTVHRLHWFAYPFRAEPYYGLRVTVRNRDARGEFHVDFTHYKIYADTDAGARQTGTWHGAPLDDDAPVRERVQSFELTHGANMLGLTYYQRFGPGDALYAGGGPAIYIPHTENRVDGLPGGDGYRLGGFGWEAAAGASRCGRNGSTSIAEVKFDRGSVRVPVAGGEARLDLRTLHELVGRSLNGVYCGKRLY